ncbi:ATP-binding domain-containing protein [Rhodococcus aerolatus]
MPFCLPEEPRLANRSEEVVWKALVDQCGHGDLLVAGQRVTDRGKDHEIDVVVALEGHGIVTVEVKGGEVWHDGTSWRQQHGRIDPVGQVRAAKYALREVLDRHPRWRGRRVRWAHVVVLPGSRLADDFETPDCPRWMVVDHAQLGDLAGLLRRVLDDQDSTNRDLTEDDVDALREALAGRSLPQRDVVARAAENDEAADLLTEQQAVILSATRHLNRVEVRGGAGSGKTYLACEQARRLSQQGLRVALVCYSHGLASYLRRLCTGWSRRHRPGYVGEFHELGLRWGSAEAPSDPALQPQFFEHELPAEMTDLADRLTDGQKFDAIVVDEAQDFADAWWTPLLAALRDPDSGGLYVFSDEGQRVFERHGTPPVPLVPLVLDANIRNTRPIAEAFTPLVGQRMRLQGGDGPAVTFLPCQSSDAVDVADDAVEALLNRWKPVDVALLTTGSRHPEQVERQAEGHEAYWDTFWDAEQVFYGHVLGFKGLERRAVVLALNSEADASRLRERVYVGLSRARDQLVVCGDPDVVRAVGGDELARRLGAA